MFVDGHIHLTDPDAMWAASRHLEGVGKFHGLSVGWYRPGTLAPDNPPEQVKWFIKVNDTAGSPEIHAEIGDHLILTYGRLLKLSHLEYQSLSEG